MKLWSKILIAIFLGVVMGVALGPQATIFKPIGTFFLGLLNMLMVPLVFASLVCGIINIPDMKKLGRIGGTAFFLYGLSTLFAIALGLSLAYWLGTGTALHLPLHEAVQTKPLPEASELLLSAVPKNPIKAFAEGNILQVIVFALFFGISLHLAGARAKPIVDCINALYNVMLKMTTIVMSFSPIGVFALMAWTSGTLGLDALLPVAKFLGFFYAASLIHVVVIFCGILWAVRLRVIPFFKAMAPSIGCALSTCSSSATLPVSIQCSIEKLGISKPLANFVLPLGASLNMNGSSLFQAMSAVFLAQAYGIELQWQHFVTLISTVLLATLGTASVPGGGLIMLSVVFSSIGIPLEAIAILAGIDRLRDMATTVLNVTGDAVCAVVIAKQEKEFDEEVYYQRVTPSPEGGADAVPQQ